MARTALFVGSKQKGPPVKRLIAFSITSLFALGLGIALLSAPVVAVGHPGNTCNPPAGHGRSGCHRVTVSSRTAARPAVAAGAQKRAASAQSPVGTKKAAPKVVTSTAGSAVPSVAATAPASLVPLHPAAPRLPWWLQIWHFLFG